MGEGMTVVDWWWLLVSGLVTGLVGFGVGYCLGVALTKLDYRR